MGYAMLEKPKSSGEHMLFNENVSTILSKVQGLGLQVWSLSLLFWVKRHSVP